MDEYDKITASHYAAYRPLLHGPILKQLLGSGHHYSVGLDVGCGTGRSAIALSDHCRHVFAIDPSPAMLAVAREHPSVEFLQQKKAALSEQVPGQRFELLSFAGSLFYQDEADVVISFSDILEDGATVLVYDYDVDLQPLLSNMDFSPTTGSYDHQRNFDAYTGKRLRLVKSIEEVLNFEITGLEAAHLLCSVSEWREELLRYKAFGELVDELTRQFEGVALKLSARCYGKLYTYQEAVTLDKD
jgi:SAM-dependent methyltransferase